MRRGSYEPRSKALSRIPTSSRQDMRRGKRVKLVDIDVDNNPMNLNFNASSMPVEVNKTTRSNDAKTSEYAFFKKLNEVAGQKFASHIVEGEPNRSNEFGLRNPSRSRENNNAVYNKDVRSSLLVENATPDVHTKKVCATFEDVQRNQKDREEDCHSLRLEDMGRGKRVKLVDIDVDNPVEVKKAVRSVDVKTSEFAFFKKLKEDTSQRFASHIAHGEPNGFGLRNTSRARENNSVVNNGYKYVRSSLPVHNATPVNFISFNSPLGDAAETRKSDVNTKKICATLEDVQWKQNDREEDSHFMRLEGTQHGHAEVFTRKRQKLNRWVTDVSFPEIDGLCSTGRDVVSVLLSRLIPESKDNNNAKDNKFGQVDTDDRYILAAYPESDIHCKQLQWMPTKHFTDLEFGPYLDEAIPLSRPNRTRERILYLDASHNHDNNNHDWYSVGQSDTELLGGNWALSTERDLSFSFPFGRFRFIEPVKELNYFPPPNRYLVGNQSDTPMLEWDFDNDRVERDFARTFQDIETNAQPASLVPWVDKDKLNVGELFSISNIHFDEESGGSLPLSCVSSYHNHEYGVQILEDKEEVSLDSNRIPLTLSWSGNYSGPPKDWYNGTGFHHQEDWFMSKFVGRGHHNSQTEDLLSSRLVIDLGCKYFPISGCPQEHHSSPYGALEYPGNQRLESCRDDSNHEERHAHIGEESESDVSIHEWSSSCFQISLDRDEAFPLILDS